MRKVTLFVFLLGIAFWPITMDGQPQPTDIVIELHIPATVIARVETAFAGSYNYQETIPNPAFNSALPEDPALNPRTVTNPESKRAFLKRMIGVHIVDVTASYEVRQAGEGARKAAQEKAGKEIKIQ